MKINIQLLGGRGASSGGNYSGSSKPPKENKPNSTYTQKRDGKNFQKRWYDDEGNPKKDKDYTDHGNSKKHPVSPHYHDWEDGERGDGYYWDGDGNKHYFEK